MISRGIARSGSHHDGVLQRAVFLEVLNDLRHVGALLADGHVNGIERPKIRVATFEALFIDAGVIDNGVDADGGFAGLAIANHEFALAAANRDHRVHRHHTRLHGLADGLPFDDAGRNFLNRIICLGGDVALAVDRPAQRVHHAAEQRLAHGHGQQIAGGLHLIALSDAGVVTENHRAHFRFLEVEREAHHAAAEVEHLVHHRAGEAFDLRHAITDLAHHAHILTRHVCFRAGDLGFNILQ